MPERPAKNNAGFTLLEVVVTVALVAILSAVAVVSLAFYIPDLRLKSAAQDINIQIQKARLEAIRSNRFCHVAFFYTIDGVVYAPVVWLDENGDALPDAAEILYRMEVQEESPGIWVIRQYGGVRYDHTFGGDGVTFAGNRLAFNRRGVSDKSGSVYLHNSRGRTRQLLVTLGGAVRVF